MKQNEPETQYTQKTAFTSEDNPWKWIAIVFLTIIIALIISQTQKNQSILPIFTPPITIKDPSSFYENSTEKPNEPITPMATPENSFSADEITKSNIWLQTKFDNNCRDDNGGELYEESSNNRLDPKDVKPSDLSLKISDKDLAELECDFYHEGFMTKNNQLNFEAIYELGSMTPYETSDDLSARPDTQINTFLTTDLNATNGIIGKDVSVEVDGLRILQLKNGTKIRIRTRLWNVIPPNNPLLIDLINKNATLIDEYCEIVNSTKTCKSYKIGTFNNNLLITTFGPEIKKATEELERRLLSVDAI